jgi:hypothetical protein
VAKAFAVQTGMTITSSVSYLSVKMTFAWYRLESSKAYNVRSIIRLPSILINNLI